MHVHYTIALWLVCIAHSNIFKWKTTENLWFVSIQCVFLSVWIYFKVISRIFCCGCCSCWCVVLNWMSFYGGFDVAIQSKQLFLWSSWRLTTFRAWQNRPHDCARVSISQWAYMCVYVRERALPSHKSHCIALQEPIDGKSNQPNRW